MLKRKLFSRTPTNVHAVGLAFMIVVLVAGALSAGLFTKLSGARVDIPAGLYGFSLSRYRDPPSYFRGGEHGTYAAVYYDEDRYHINRGETIERMIGPKFYATFAYYPTGLILIYPGQSVYATVFKQAKP